MHPNHLITNKVANRVRTVMEKQDYKGYEKYGKELDHKDNYNWNEMAYEEIADFLKYWECARLDKEDIIYALEQAAFADNMESKQKHILTALDILTKGK